MTQTPECASPLTWEQLCEMPLPDAVPRLPYGSSAQQFGELRLPLPAREPEGSPLTHWPVMALVHGGCWRNRFDLVYITRLAAWLSQRGWATWTIEYRRLGDEGGGWPGTLRDAGAALDALRTMAETAPLDLGRVCVTGHSAGGHLALWLASRNRLAPDSDLYQPDPLPVAGVLGLAAITDLVGFRIGPPDSCHAAVVPLMGGQPREVPQRYAQASPLALLPLGVPQVFIQGGLDDTVSADSVRAYVVAAKMAGDPVNLLELPDAGHFDAVVATAISEAALTAALDWLLQIR